MLEDNGNNTVKQSFERYRDSVISDFIEDLKTNGYPEPTAKQLGEIKEEFEKHRLCYNDNVDLFNKYDEEIFSVACYTNKAGSVCNLTIECYNCGTTITT